MKTAENPAVVDIPETETTTTAGVSCGRCSICKDHSSSLVPWYERLMMNRLNKQLVIMLNLQTTSIAKQTNKQQPTMLNHANIAFTPGMGIHTYDKASKQPHGKLTKQTESQEIGQSTSG